MEGAIFDQMLTLTNARSLVIDLFFSLPKKIQHDHLHGKFFGWTPPPPSFIELNSNASARGNPGFASAGGLLRDSNENWISGFTRKIGFTTSLAAELWGLWDGLRLALSLNNEKIIVDVDAIAVVDLINAKHAETMQCHPYSVLLDDCREMIQCFEEAQLHHVVREGNHCADLLAKAGNTSILSFMFFRTPPSFVVSQLLVDYCGVTYPRLCNN